VIPNEVIGGGRRLERGGFHSCKKALGSDIWGEWTTNQSGEKKEGFNLQKRRAIVLSSSEVSPKGNR